MEYIARILSAPALYPGRKAVKARLKYTFSFYGFVDFVAVLPCILTYIYWDTEVVHVIILPYILSFQTDTALSFFPDYRPGALSRKRGT